MYEEYKQAAYDTLSKLAVYTELARRINNNLSQITKMMKETIETGYSPKDISFNRYVKINRTISFPEWLSLVLGVNNEATVWSIHISESKIALKTSFGNGIKLYITRPSIENIIIFSLLDDYTWKRIMNNIRKLDSEYQRVVEYIYNMRNVLRNIFDREEILNENYSDILHKRYDVNKRLYNAVANIIELALSYTDWASFTTTSNKHKDIFVNKLLDTGIDPVLFIEYMNAFYARKNCDRNVSIPQEIIREKSTVIKKLNGIEVCNTCITLYVTEEDSIMQYDNIQMTLVESTSAITIRKLVLAHYMLTDEDWQWIYDTMIHYLKLSEIAKKKINEAYTLIRLAS